MGIDYRTRSSVAWRSLFSSDRATQEGVIAVRGVAPVALARKAQAALFAAKIPPIIRDVHAACHTSLNGIAGQLGAALVSLSK